LRPGDVVGLVAPSGVASEAQLERGIANLESLGLKPRLARNVRAARGGYAGTVAQRVEDLHAMFADREVRALWAARGGSGCSALLPHLDFALIRANPKVLVGYSDVCALQLALLRRSGLVTFHGPVSSSTFSEFSAVQLRAVLFEGAAPTFPLPAALDEPRTLRAGRAEGPLLGGNLSVLCSLLGTPYMPDAAGALLFLEDVGEAPYRIDRMLVQLEQAGITPAVSGVALGVFRKCVPTDDEPSLTLQEVFEDRFAGQRSPCGWGFPFGHIPEQVTLPLGVRARLDVARRELTLLEPGVSER
jgi:muramoyltetrapeptide carboxypeptidase